MERQSDSYQDLLRDLVTFFRKVGAEAERESTAPDEGSLFQEGRVAAYREVLNSIKNHIVSFSIPPEEVGLDGFDPLIDALALPPELDT